MAWVIIGSPPRGHPLNPQSQVINILSTIAAQRATCVQTHKRQSTLPSAPHPPLVPDISLLHLGPSTLSLASSTFPSFFSKRDKLIKKKKRSTDTQPPSPSSPTTFDAPEFWLDPNPEKMDDIIDLTNLPTPHPNNLNTPPLSVHTSHDLGPASSGCGGSFSHLSDQGSFCSSYYSPSPPPTLPTPFTPPPAASKRRGIAPRRESKKNISPTTKVIHERPLPSLSLPLVPASMGRIGSPRRAGP
jgi:hypothetical protein